MDRIGRNEIVTGHGHAACRGSMVCQWSMPSPLGRSSQQGQGAAHGLALRLPVSPQSE